MPRLFDKQFFRRMFFFSFTLYEKGINYLSPFLLDLDSLFTYISLFDSTCVIVGGKNAFRESMYVH